MMMRHPLHIQNHNDEASISIARLLLAIDAVDTNRALGDVSAPVVDTAIIPMQEWSEIVDTCSRIVHGRFKQAAGQPLTAILEEVARVNLTRCYDVKTITVRVPLTTWSTILASRDVLQGSPSLAAATATERYIRTGRF